jgi:hypothetical protein
MTDAICVSLHTLHTLHTLLTLLMRVGVLLLVAAGACCQATT